MGTLLHLLSSLKAKRAQSVTVLVLVERYPPSTCHAMHLMMMIGSKTTMDWYSANKYDHEGTPNYTGTLLNTRSITRRSSRNYGSISWYTHRDRSVDGSTGQPSEVGPSHTSHSTRHYQHTHTQHKSTLRYYPVQLINYPTRARYSGPSSLTTVWCPTVRT